MKVKLIVAIAVLIIILPVAWYLVSPVFRVVEINESSPFNDRLDKMDSKAMANFTKEVDAMKDKSVEIDDSMPSGTKVLSKADFMPRAHDVKGKAFLIEKDGKKIIRFENFMTINGPDLHIYLSSELGDADYIDLGKIKATKGNVNYEVPAGVNIKKYNRLLVWCQPFQVLFSYASFS